MTLRCDSCSPPLWTPVLCSSIISSKSTIRSAIRRGRVLARNHRSPSIAASDTLGAWGEHLIAQADAAVYLAKRLGRNQVQMAARLAA
jgi:PleD family two-component response regulator